MLWQEAAIAAVSSLIWFVVYSTAGAIVVGEPDRFPAILRCLFAPGIERGPTRKRLSAAAAGVFAALGQAAVVAVAARGDALDPVARLILGGEVVAVVFWMLLLRRWLRSSTSA